MFALSFNNTLRIVQQRLRTDEVLQKCFVEGAIGRIGQGRFVAENPSLDRMNIGTVNQVQSLADQIPIRFHNAPITRHRGGTIANNVNPHRLASHSGILRRCCRNKYRPPFVEGPIGRFYNLPPVSSAAHLREEDTATGFGWDQIGCIARPII